MRVVARLLLAEDRKRPLDFKNYVVAMDRLYTSPSLFLFLCKRGFHLVGTCQCNRIGYPKEIVPAKGTKIVPGEYKCMHLCRPEEEASTLYATRWHDKKKMILMLSTFDAPIGRVPKKVKATATQPFHWTKTSKPSCVCVYNRCMGGTRNVRA